MLGSLLRLFAITFKELRHISRDFRIFFLVTLSPAFLLLVLSYIFAFDVGHVSLAWLDQDRTPTSRSYLAALTADGIFAVRAQPGSYAEGENLLLEGRADVLVAVPHGFEDDLLAGRPADVQAIADGADAILTGNLLSNLAARTSAFGARLSQRAQPLRIATRAWYNNELKSLWSMVPGLLGIVLTLPSLALTLAIGRERETGTFEALITTPVLGFEYQLGKVLAYVLTGLVSAVLALVVAIYWFGVPFRGSLALFLLLTVDYYLASMGIALLVARFMVSQQTAMLAVLLIFFVPGFFIAGLISPVRESSLPALLTSYALPITHFIVIARGIFLKGVGLAEMSRHVLLLTGMAAGAMGLSLAVFRKRMP